MHIVFLMFRGPIGKMRKETLKIIYYTECIVEIVAAAMALRSFKEGIKCY